MSRGGYESIEERARIKPNSTEAIAVIAINDELRKMKQEKRRAFWRKLTKLFSGKSS